MELGECALAYWPEHYGKLYGKNQVVTVNHLKSLYQFLVSVEA